MTDVWVDDQSHIYTAGVSSDAIRNNTDQKACYWKDNQEIELPTTPGHFSKVRSLCVANNDVYSCGIEYIRQRNPNIAGEYYYASEIDGLIWKNNTLLYKVPNADFYKIKMINGSVYACGVKYKENTSNTVLYK